MYWNKETGPSHPPGLTAPVEGQHGAANSFEADFMSLPFMPLSSAFYSHHDIRQNFQPYSFEGENGNATLSDHMDLNIDANLINAKIDTNNNVGADYLMNASSSSIDYLESQDLMNFMPPRGDSGSGYPMKAYGAKANTSGISSTSLSLHIPFPSDMDFLTLGIGGGTIMRPNNNFSTREIATKLEEAYASQSNPSLVGQSPNYPFSLDKLTGRPVQANAMTNSNPFPSLQTPQANLPPDFLATSDSFEFDLNPSLPFPRNFPVCRERVASFPLRPQSTRPTYFSSPSISDRQHDYHRNNYMNVSPESSTSESSISHAQLGSVIPFAEGIQTQTGYGVTFPGSVRPVGNQALRTEDSSTEIARTGSFPSTVQPVGTSHNVGLFPERIKYHIPKSSSFQPAGDGPFPKRLGVQPVDFSTARTAKGPPPLNLAASFRPLAPSGQVDVRPQDSPIISRPCSKRRATENPPIVQPSLHRKNLPQLKIPQGRYVPAPILGTAHIPPAPLHVKWKGFDEPPKTMGHKCLLCKRDLSFTAEGPVYEPAIPPAVAVLPCGHTFHDLCLERINTKDHSKDPPCIPCAIGEA